MQRPRSDTVGWSTPSAAQSSPPSPPNHGSFQSTGLPAPFQQCSANSALVETVGAATHYTSLSYTANRATPNGAAAVRPGSGGAISGSSAMRSTTAGVPLPGSPWARRSTDLPRSSHSYTAEGSTMPRTTQSTTLPSLTRLSPYTRPTASALSAGVSCASARQALDGTPLRPAPPAVKADAWTRHGGLSATSAAAATTYLVPYANQSTSKPEGCPLVQLELSHFSVRGLNVLDGGRAAVGTVLLRGTMGGASSHQFSTEGVWPVEERSWAGEHPRRGDAVQLLSASWPRTTTVTEVVEDVSRQAVGTAHPPPRRFLCECYVCHSPPNSPPQLRSEAYVGRGELELEELIEAARVDVQRSQPAEVALRNDSGAVVGRLSFAVALLPLPSRTVRVRGVVLQPDPLRVDNGHDERSSAFTLAAVERRRGPPAVVYEGDLALSLAAPPATAAATPHQAGDGPLVAADSRTSAAVRWTALPLFTFHEVPATVTQAVRERTSRRDVSARPPLPPLVLGQLFYCPPRPRQEESRVAGALSSGSPILLGTFAIPPPPPPSQHSSMSSTSAAAVGTAAAVTYGFRVPLRTSAEGARWMAMGDCWVRGVMDTWAEENSAVSGGCSEAFRYAATTAQPATEHPRMAASPPPRSAACSTDGGQGQRMGDVASEGGERAGNAAATQTAQPPSTPPPRQPTTPTPPPTPVAAPQDIALQRVRERQEALLQRVEFRLAEVRQQRERLRQEMAAQEAEAAAEESAILEEFGLLESQQSEAETAYREATEQLAELQQLYAEQAADEEAYLAEQTRAMEEVARERAEALELRAQLETLQVQMKAHMAAEQQRYAARVEHTRAAVSHVEANTRWLTEVEAKIAAAAFR